ncbi:hypothetical protein [Streptosporangium sp. NPDC049078]|uniref:hypothetical protein n=1 Tax=Streptosporangium sp. NPDC049078 TaxID=3155767 RepID=UPI00343ED4A2
MTLHTEPTASERRAALEFTYPGWTILRLRATNRWYASRTSPLSDNQRAAGVVAGFTCDTYDEFTAALAEQAELVDRCGGYRP